MELHISATRGQIANILRKFPFLGEGENQQYWDAREIASQGKTETGIVHLLWRQHLTPQQEQYLADMSDVLGYELRPDWRPDRAV